MLEEHLEYTGSSRHRILADFEKYLPKFKKSYRMIT